MAFCQNCGASVDGAFCTNCGKPMGDAAPPAPQAASPAAPAAPTAQGAKKRGPPPYILVGCFGLVVLAAIGVMATGWFVKSKLQNAGIDADLMKRNPALASAKLITAMNPNIEVVTVDEGKGTITLKEKSSGRVVTLNFDDVQKGKISFKEEGKGEFSMSSGAGTVAPDWVPPYPGSQGQAVISGTDKSGTQGTFTFSTKDSVDQVVAYYAKELPAKGYTVERTMSTRQAGTQMEVLTGTAAGRTLRLSVVSSQPGETAVSATLESK